MQADGAAAGPRGRMRALQPPAPVGARGPRTHDGHAGVGKGHVDGPQRRLGRRDGGLHLQRARAAARWRPGLSHVWLSAAEARCEQLSLMPGACLFALHLGPRSFDALQARPAGRTSDPRRSVRLGRACTTI